MINIDYLYKHLLSSYPENLLDESMYFITSSFEYLYSIFYKSLHSAGIPRLSELALNNEITRNWLHREIYCRELKRDFIYFDFEYSPHDYSYPEEYESLSNCSKFVYNKTIGLLKSLYGKIEYFEDLVEDGGLIQFKVYCDSQKLGQFLSKLSKLSSTISDSIESLISMINSPATSSIIEQQLGLFIHSLIASGLSEQVIDKGEICILDIEAIRDIVGNEDFVNDLSKYNIFVDKSESGNYKPLMKIEELTSVISYYIFDTLILPTVLKCSDIEVYMERIENSCEDSSEFVVPIKISIFEENAERIFNIFYEYTARLVSMVDILKSIELRNEVLNSKGLALLHIDSIDRVFNKPIELYNSNSKLDIATELHVNRNMVLSQTEHSPVGSDDIRFIDNTGRQLIINIPTIRNNYNFTNEHLNTDLDFEATLTSLDNIVSNTLLTNVYFYIRQVINDYLNDMSEKDIIDYNAWCNSPDFVDIKQLRENPNHTPDIFTGTDVDDDKIKCLFVLMDSIIFKEANENVKDYLTDSMNKFFNLFSFDNYQNIISQQQNHNKLDLHPAVVELINSLAADCGKFLNFID